MKKKLCKVLIPFTLALAMAMPIYADQTPTDPQSTNDQAEAQESGEYENMMGVITGLSETGLLQSIHVQTKDKGEFVYHIAPETIVLSEKTMGEVEFETFEIGMEVLAAYRTNTAMTMSLPPQLTPIAIVMKDGELNRFIKIDQFDKNALSSDGQLKLNLSDKTTVIDLDAKPVAHSDMANKTLIVFYDVTTRSLPPQTAPIRVIVLDVKAVEPKPVAPEETTNEAEEGELGQTISEEDKKLASILATLTSDQLIEINGVEYVKLRDVASELDYAVTWDDVVKTARLQKGVVTAEIRIGTVSYSFNRESASFAAEPLLIDGTTYVEAAFMSKLVQ